MQHHINCPLSGNCSYATPFKDMHYIDVIIMVFSTKFAISEIAV